MIVHAYCGEATHHLKDGRIRRFRPKGEMFVVTNDGRAVGAAERAKNPVERYGQGGWAARLFVGLSVGDTPKYTVQMVIDAVIAERKKRGRLPDSSYLAQKGVYTEDKSGQLVTEDSVQIIVIDLQGLDRKTFTDDMLDLGETLRKKFEQESVIVEIQNRGVVRDVFSVKP